MSNKNFVIVAGVAASFLATTPAYADCSSLISAVFVLQHKHCEAQEGGRFTGQLTFDNVYSCGEGVCFSGTFTAIDNTLAAV